MPHPPIELLTAEPKDPMVALHLTRCVDCRTELQELANPSPDQSAADSGWLLGRLPLCGTAPPPGLPKAPPEPARGQIWSLHRDKRAEWFQPHYYALILGLDPEGSGRVRILGLMFDEEEPIEQLQGLLVFEPFVFECYASAEQAHDDLEESLAYKGLLAIPEAICWVNRSLLTIWDKVLEERIVAALERFQDGGGNVESIIHVMGGPRPDPDPTSDLPSDMGLMRDNFRSALVKAEHEMASPIRDNQGE